MTQENLEFDKRIGITLDNIANQLAILLQASGNQTAHIKSIYEYLSNNQAMLEELHLLTTGATIINSDSSSDNPKFYDFVKELQKQQTESIMSAVDDMYSKILKKLDEMKQGLVDSSTMGLYAEIANILQEMKDNPNTQDLNETINPQLQRINYLERLIQVMENTYKNGIGQQNINIGNYFASPMFISPFAQPYNNQMNIGQPVFGNPLAFNYPMFIVQPTFIPYPSYNPMQYPYQNPQYVGYNQPQNVQQVGYPQFTPQNMEVQGQPQPATNPINQTDANIPNPVQRNDKNPEVITVGNDTPVSEGGNATPARVPTSETPVSDATEDLANPVGGERVETPKPKKVEPKPEPEFQPRKLRVKLIDKSLKETEILAEPKPSFFRRIATFTAKHPVATTLIGAGAGLAFSGTIATLTGLSAGYTLIQGLNKFISSIALTTGAGALLGVTGHILGDKLGSRISKSFLKARTERLFDRVKSIDKSREWVAEFEEQHKKEKESARERARNSKGLCKVKNKVCKCVHKQLEKAGRKLRRLREKQFIKAADKALDAKSKLNEKEEKSGKTLAMGGLLQKKRKLDKLKDSGKLSEEDYKDSLEDLTDDLIDKLDRDDVSFEGLEEHKTFDKEANEVAEKALELTKGTSGEKSTYKDIIADIKHRHSARKAEFKIKEVEVEAPEDLDEVAKSLRKQARSIKNRAEKKAINSQAEAIEDKAEKISKIIEASKLASQDPEFKKHLADRGINPDSFNVVEEIDDGLGK